MLAGPNMGGVSAGRSKYGRRQCWQVQIWEASVLEGPNMGGVSAGRSKYGRRQCWQVQIWEASVLEGPNMGGVSAGRSKYGRRQCWKDGHVESFFYVGEYPKASGRPNRIFYVGKLALFGRPLALGYHEDVFISEPLSSQ